MCVVCVVRASAFLCLHGFSRRGFPLHHVSYLNCLWVYNCSVLASDSITSFSNETEKQQSHHLQHVFKSANFSITTEFTRNQQIDAMTHENYMLTDASHYQEKLPKYAPIFVAVSFNESCARTNVNVRRHRAIAWIYYHTFFVEKWGMQMKSSMFVTALCRSLSLSVLRMRCNSFYEHKIYVFFHLHLSICLF